MFVQHLQFAYPKSRALLHDVAFTLQPNKLNVLIGMNGSGKTTLFDCMTGALRPQAGDIALPDQSDILYLTQSIYYSDELKGKDVAYFIGRLAQLTDFKKQTTYSASLQSRREIDLFHHLWQMKVGKMSAGEKKWLFVTLLTTIPRALYMFDEPTSGVDPATRLHIMRRFEKLIADGRTCLFSTHQLHDLLHTDAHVIFLHDGSIVYEGDFQDWLQTFQTTDPDVAFTKMLDLATEPERANTMP